MAIVRDDRWCADAQGRALAGAQVYWCTQPASTATNPPSPLATAYIDLAEDPLTQPALTDGFGHAFAYLDDSVLYTVVIWHPLFGENPVVLPDQSLAGGGGGGSSLIPFAGTPSQVRSTERTRSLLSPCPPTQHSLPCGSTSRLSMVLATHGHGRAEH